MVVLYVMVDQLVEVVMHQVVGLLNKAIHFGMEHNMLLVDIIVAGKIHMVVLLMMVVEVVGQEELVIKIMVV